MSNAYDFYYQAYNSYNDRLIPSLYTQIQLLNEVLELDKLQDEVNKAIRTGDQTLIKQAEDQYNKAAKASKKITRKLKFWKTLAIIEGGIIMGVTGAILIITYI